MTQPAHGGFFFFKVNPFTEMERAWFGLKVQLPNVVSRALSPSLEAAAERARDHARNIWPEEVAESIDVWSEGGTAMVGVRGAHAAEAELLEFGRPDVPLKPVLRTHLVVGQDRITQDFNFRLNSALQGRLPDAPARAGQGYF